MIDSPEPTAVVKVKSKKQWDDALDTAKDDNHPVIVDFSATWCGPCKMIAPKYKEIASRYPHTVFLKVDVDEMDVIAQEFGIKTMPTFLALAGNGELLDKVVGTNVAAIEQMVARHAAVPPSKEEKAKKAEKEGDELLDNGEYARAAENYTHAIQLAPDSTMIYVKRADANIKQVKALRVAALADAERATALDPENGAGWLRKGEALLVSADDEGPGRPEEGLAVRLGKRFNEAYVALENAVTYATGRDKEEAKRLVLDTMGRQKAMQ